MRARKLFWGTAAALVLCACGGGGDGPASPPPSTSFEPSRSLQGMCSLEGQKKFMRSYLDEVYLWYGEIPEVDASRYNRIPDYFDALLVTTPDANGLPRDRYSAVVPLNVATDTLTGGNSVPVVKTVTTPGGRLGGYIRFDDHAEGAQDELIDAFRQLRDAQVQDLVLDMRANGGGYLYVALSAASMVVGPAKEGLLFEQLRYNDKRAAETAASAFHFTGRVQYGETKYFAGSPLPQLDLPRVYVLSSERTCSSSESVINGLRGVDVEVVLVGGATCGKPFGFRQKNNCGWAYFPIEFQGFNAKGFGDYTAGFQPTCAVDDNAAAAGSEPDPLLATALHHMDAGACPAPGSATARLAQSATPPVTPLSASRPAWAGRLLREH